jgi:rod shape-determining protein MreC
MIFGVAMFFCIGLLGVGLIGLSRPAENILSIPFSLIQRASAGVVRNVNTFLRTAGDFQNLERRNEELERALVNYQSEIVQLREIKAEYDRLTALMNYRSLNADQKTIVATVIGRDTTGLVRAISIDRGSRDGITVGMPVITELGLVGRVNRVAATSAQVQLIIDVNSFVNARLQTPAQDLAGPDNRTEGAVQGTPAGGLQMIFIPLNDAIQDGDSVVTSGLGGVFPRGILIGQITSKRLDDSQLFQSAEVRSLIDFTRLEMVMVITNFEAVETDFNRSAP